MERTVNENNIEFDLSFQVQLPNEWNPFLAKQNIGITAAVETNTCNPEWVECCERMDKVIVPSEFTKEVLVNTGVKSDLVEVVHETYPTMFDNEDFVRDDYIDSVLDGIKTKRNFLVLGQITGMNIFSDRKNLFNTIKAFVEAYKNDKDVGLIFKTNVGRNTKIDRTKTLSLVKNLLKELGKDVYPKVHVLHGNLSENQLKTLYTHDKVSYLLTATRGEGFGLPILEAASQGLPVIATNWSGHLDFMKLGNFTRLPYKLIEIHETRVDNKIFMKGTKWAEVSYGQLRLALKKAFDNYAKDRKNAKDLAEGIKENFNFNKIKEDYNSFIESM
jgi:glycosyltransferase involved in cell wall biosynthesis